MSIRRRMRRIPPWWRRFKRNGYHIERCDYCGHRFAWKGDARHSYGHGDGKVWHGPCMALLTSRNKAEERLTVLALICDIWEVAGSDVRELMANRAMSEGYERSNAWNLAWRVFYDLEKSNPADRTSA